MSSHQPVGDAVTVESGIIRFLYRPRVEQTNVSSLDDVQRLLILLAPASSPFQRLIAIGRKRFEPRARFWGFVDLILTAPDMEAALAPQVYGTRTLGLRHLPAAERFAAGDYSIDLHREHGHLRWNIGPEGNDRLAFHRRDHPTSRRVRSESQLESSADYIITIANPDPVVWGLEELPDIQGELFDEIETHVTLPSPFPPEIQSRFEGRKFAQLDSIAWLNHPGAELVFIPR